MPHAKEQLIERLQKQKEAFKDSDAKWNEVRSQWIAELKSLFDKFDGWLKPLMEKGLIRVEESSQQIQESDLDPYDAPVRKLITPTGAKLHIQPVARVVFEGQGRVDFLAGGRTAMLIKDPKRGWCFVLGSRTIRAFEELTEDSFFQYVMQLLS
ncbi:MAG: hypothetical protein IT463_08350 [Planctomycetes bacterium]|nr:hypothetical protein [Planctomycetota bacterium]